MDTRAAEIRSFRTSEVESFNEDADLMGDCE